VVVLLRERNEGDEVKAVDCRPFLNDPKVELESVSDSSNWNHMGNGSPCPNYNYDGCTRGVKCEFSHGPGYKSVRDRLCVFFSAAQMDADFGC
jgi:hypothetical protein